MKSNSTIVRAGAVTKVLVLLAFAIAGASSAAAQTTITPDCVIAFDATASGSTPTNTCGKNVIGIVEWQLWYKSTGFSAVVVTVEEASDVAGAPGSWSTFTAMGNPATSTAQANFPLSGYFPWNRVTYTLTGTGHITGQLYGCRSPGCAGGTSTGGGGGGSGCPGTLSTPCLTASYNGAALIPQIFYNHSAVINSTNTARNTLVTASSGKATYVAAVYLSNDSLVGLIFGYATDCTSTVTPLTGNMPILTAALGFAEQAPLIVPAGDNLCMTVSTGTNTVQGVVIYGQQ